MVPCTPSIALTASIALPPDSPRACWAASSRIASCSRSRISERSRSSDERWAKSVLSSSERLRSRFFFSEARSSTLFSLSVGLRLFGGILLVQLPEEAGEAFEFGRPHPALLDQHVLPVEDLRALAFLLLGLFQERKQPVAGAFRVLAVLPDLDLELLQLGLCGRHFHRDVRPVDGQGPDLVRALRDPTLGPLRVHIDAVDRLEVRLLLLPHPDDRLLGELDPALRLLELRDQLEVVGPALLIDQFVDVFQVCLEVRGARSPRCRGPMQCG